MVVSPEDDTEDEVDKAYRIEADSVAAARDTVAYAAANDRTPVQVRLPDAAKLRDIQTDRAYRYGTEAPPHRQSLGSVLGLVLV